MDEEKISKEISSIFSLLDSEEVEDQNYLVSVSKRLDYLSTQFSKIITSECAKGFYPTSAPTNGDDIGNKIRRKDKRTKDQMEELNKPPQQLKASEDDESHSRKLSSQPKKKCLNRSNNSSCAIELDNPNIDDDSVIVTEQPDDNDLLLIKSGNEYTGVNFFFDSNEIYEV